MTNNDNSNSDQVIQPSRLDTSSGKVGAMSRRLFLSKGMAAAGSIILTSGLSTNSLTARAASGAKLDASTLKSKFNFKGDVFRPPMPISTKWHLEGSGINCSQRVTPR